MVPIEINSRKFDGSIRRSWNCALQEANRELLVFVGEFESEVRHPQLGVIRPGTISYEYYWMDRWYNVFRFHEPDGEFRNFYCNLNMPPAFENGVLDYVDLDIDVLVWPDHRIEILDVDDYERNAATYGYPDEIRTKVKESLDEVLKLIEKRDFPFDVTVWP